MPDYEVLVGSQGPATSSWQFTSYDDAMRFAHAALSAYGTDYVKVYRIAEGGTKERMWTRSNDCPS